MTNSGASEKAYAFAISTINLLNAEVNNKVQHDNNLIEKSDWLQYMYM